MRPKNRKVPQPKTEEQKAELLRLAEKQAKKAERKAAKIARDRERRRGVADPNSRTQMKKARKRQLQEEMQKLADQNPEPTGREITRADRERIQRKLDEVYETAKRETGERIMQTYCSSCFTTYRFRESQMNNWCFDCMWILPEPTFTGEYEYFITKSESEFERDIRYVLADLRAELEAEYKDEE